MKTWKIVAGLFGVSLFFTYLTLQNAFDRNKNYMLVVFPTINVCYSVTTEYELEFFSDGFNYKGGKNLGEVRLLEGTLPPDFIRHQMGDFQAAYTKIKNYRIVHYQVNDSQVVVDRFQSVKRMPLNLTPSRSACEVLAQKASKIVNIGQN